MEQIYPTKRIHILLIILGIFLLLSAGYFMYPSFIKNDITNVVKGTQDSVTKSRELFSIPLIDLSNTINSYLTHQGVIKDTNTERMSNGLPALTENAKLDAAAQAKLEDMFQNQYFDHISPSGNGPGYLAQNQDYAYLIVGENLALGNFKNDQALLDAWMASPGHRANILNPKFTDFGIAVGKGIYKGQETWLAVQEFGLPASVCPAISTSLKDQINKDQATSDTDVAELNSIKQELDSMPQDTQEERDAYNAKVNTYNQLVNAYTTLTNRIHTEVDMYNAEVNVFNTCLNAHD